MDFPQQIYPTPTQADDDYTLMSNIRGKDASALSALYDRYSSVVYSLCLRGLRNPSDAEDLLIEIFSELWDRSDRYNSLRGKPLTYILGMARSRLTDRLRARRSRLRIGGDGRSEEVDDTASRAARPLDAVVLAEQQQRVVAAVATLAPEQREALEMAFFDAMSHAQIAEKLEQPLGTVKSRVRQALIHLRDALSGDNAMQ